MADDGLRNRRRGGRVPTEGVSLEAHLVGLTLRVQTNTLRPTPNLAAGILDLSSGGIGFLCRNELKVRDRLVMRIRLPDLEHPIEASGRVKWSRKVPGSEPPAWEVGAEFTDIRSDDRVRLRDRER